MSTVIQDENIAQRRIESFERQYGKLALLFASHAALPVALNSAFVHLLRINFFMDPPEDLPSSIEAELLLSTLCREIDDDLYEMEIAIRNLLLKKLSKDYDAKRVRDIAQLLWEYTENVSPSPWGNSPRLERAQKLTVLNFLDPEKASEWLRQAEIGIQRGAPDEEDWVATMRVALQETISFSTELSNAVILPEIFSNVTYAIFVYVSKNYNLSESVIKWINREPAKLAFQKALARSYAAFARHYPDYLEVFFDEAFLKKEALPELSKLLIRNQHPDPAALAQLWGRSLGANADFAKRATKPASDFLTWLDAELKSEQAFQPLYDSRALDGIEAGIENLTLELRRSLDAALKNAGEYMDLNVGGDIANSVITTGNYNQVSFDHYYSGNFASLKDLYETPDAVFKRVRVEEFIGRAWLTTKVKEFLHDPKRRSGAFLIEGEAGVGKSAFMAHLVHTEGYLHLFGEQFSGNTRVQGALLSLGAQLVACYRLTDYGKREDLIYMAGASPQFLQRLLQSASQKLSAGEKIVIICDALDEAGSFPDGNVFGLPDVLPDGVYFILSQRPVPTKLPNIVAETLTLQTQSDENLDDMEAFLGAAAKRTEIINQLRAKHISEETFIHTMKEKSLGVWIYLYYVLDMQNGYLAPLDLDSMPTGLMGYYSRYWGDWRDGRRGNGEQKWDALYAPLLTTLAAAQEAITVEQLIVWAGVQASPWEVIRLLHGDWRAFVTEKTSGEEKKYALYHLSLRDFLTGKIGIGKLPRRQANLANDLSTKTMEAHQRIVNFFEIEHGGQREKLIDQDYARLHLKTHQAYVNKPEDLGTHVFVSYSTGDGLIFTQKMVDELEAGNPSIKTWFDKRDLESSKNIADQLTAAIRGCKCMIFVMSKDSTAEGSDCKDEWILALKYKKPVIPILIDKNAQLPFQLGSRQYIDFVANFDSGVANLRMQIAHLDSSEGQLHDLQQRLTDANRDLRRAKPEDAARVQADIDDLKKQIEVQQNVVNNLKAAQEQTQKNIEAGLERERKPEKPTATQATIPIINHPPILAPSYFQDRLLETKQTADFLNNDSQRLMTIVGRGGTGKTAMVCRLLKGLEGGELPDGLGKMRVEGIVYLSESGSHRVNFVNLFYDLCKLLRSDAAQELDAVYKNPQVNTESKMRALLEKLDNRRVVVLLDNFETLVDTEALAIRDSQLDEALRAFLNGTHTTVKVIITTRVAPRALNLIQPGRQLVLQLDEGLVSPYAENILREMDRDGRLGLKSAEPEALNRAGIKTRGFPRALEALFAILASDRYTTIEELLDMPLPENVVEALVGEAFNRLDTNAQKVMQALAVYNRPVPPAAVDYLLAPHLPAMDSAPILQRLASMHFARKESGRFYLHPADREFALSLIPTKLKDSNSFVEKGRTGQFNQNILLQRAADYFAQARKPRAEWKKLEDLSAQLAEFDLHCAADDYNGATSILSEIDYDYLLLWGHYHLTIELHERLQGKIEDWQQDSLSTGILGLAYYQIGQIQKAISLYEKALIINKSHNSRQGEGIWLGNLGRAYAKLGNIYKSIEFYEEALVINREIGNRSGEGNILGNLGNAYMDLDEAHKAIEFYQQALVIAREIGNRRGESIEFENISRTYLSLAEYKRSIENYQKAIQIADEISFSSVQQNARYGQAEAFLFQNDLVNSRATIEAALQYDVPENNHNASALHGIIALRQGDEVTARGAFVRAIRQADEILSKTEEFYSALDAKGLALCGMAICENKIYAAEAVEAFRKARNIASHSGAVKSTLRLFDEILKCNGSEILKDVKSTVERFG